MRAKPRTSSCFRPMCAIPRSPTTTVQASRCSHILRSGWRACGRDTVTDSCLRRVRSARSHGSRAMRTTANASSTGLSFPWSETAAARPTRKAGVAIAAIDRAVIHTLRHSGLTPTILDFSPYGYDERQYCSPGFNLPVGLFQRSKFGEIPEYHTSADNLDFIAPNHLALSYRLDC